MTLGIVSQRNEDGTSYLANIEGEFCWAGTRKEATPVPHIVYAQIEATASESRKRDCPDNGFFGIYNLKFTEVAK